MAYTYDESGNMTSEGTRGYFFDSSGRLREVMDPERGRIGNYDYDAAGYRVRTEAQGIETFLIRDAAGQVLTEYQRPVGSSADPVWNKDYIYALGKSIALIRNDAPPMPKRPWATLLPAHTDLSTGLRLKWAAVIAPDILKYLVEFRWKEHPGDATEQITTEEVIAPTVQWDRGYSAEAASSCLTFSVSAVDTAGNASPPSPPLVICLSEAAPPAPSGVFAVPGDKSVTIRWTPLVASGTHVLGYYVQRQDVVGNLNDEFLTAAVFVDREVINDHSYSYTVRTVDTANRLSAPSTATPLVTPHDDVPPGKVADVFAEPDLAAGLVSISWKRGIDTDIAAYQVFRLDSDTAPTTESPIQTVTVVAGQEPPESYSITYQPPTLGLSYYCVKAIDSATPANVSTASNRASARPRTPLTSGAPVVTSAIFGYYDYGTSSTHGMLGSFLDAGNTDAEDDDIIKATVQWTAATGFYGFQVYRKALAEIHFTPVGPQLSGSTRTYGDTTIKGGDYTYFVAAVLNSAGEEGASSTAPSGQTGHFNYAADWQTVKVRNLHVADSRDFFFSDNKESRGTVITWSRVPEPELVGYSVYRMCDFLSCDEAILAGRMDHFACEPNWIRLNGTPIPPEQRHFEDSTTGGMGGCFLYAVRPVGPSYVEGPIGKIVAADLSVGQPDDDSAEHSYAARYLVKDVVPEVEELVDTALNGINGSTGINDILRGDGATAGPTPPVESVSRSLGTKPGLDGGTVVYPDTWFATISWSWGSTPPPRDLAGFHVEVAGSRNGPWQRLTKRPVAWWEGHYTSQGVGVTRCGGDSGHTGCLSYRVIAVDEAGNESLPVQASNNPLIGNCHKTPEPPKNLRVSNGTPLSSPPRCAILLEWDASPDATEYYVYRLLLNSDHAPFFYDTERVPVSGQEATYSYVETGEDLWNYCAGNVPGDVCGYPQVDDQHQRCRTVGLEAFYVTARNDTQTGGESPRSNLVFWKCGTSTGAGYAGVLSEETPADSIAALDAQRPNESLACWNNDGASPGGLGNAEMDAHESSLPPALATAPMLRLGQVSNPPWKVLELHTDHLGSVRVISDQDGMLVSKHNYFPFGQDVPPSTLSYNTHQYTGHARDKETGLDYMLARYYEAGLGRFISVDPVARLGQNLLSPQRWNRYSYALNNPIKFFDPDGRDVTLIGAARDVAKSAYKNSDSFRVEFDAAKNNPNVHITMRLTGPSRSSREGIGDLTVTTTKTSDGGTVRKVDGPVAVETAGKGEAQSGAVMGHELKHVNNLADPNKRPAGTAKDELKLGEAEADEVQKNVKDDYQDESDDVTDAQAEAAVKGTEPKTPEKKK